MDKAFQATLETERKCLQLEKEVEQLKQGTLTKSDNTDPELSTLQTENLKLKYQLEFIQKSIREEMDLQTKPSSVNGVDGAKETNVDAQMVNILGEVRESFRIAITTAFPSVKNPPITVAVSSFADYQCNSALPLVKMLKDKQLKPFDIANKIIAAMPKSEFIGQLVPAGPGFINIVLNKETIGRKIHDILTHGISVKHENIGKKIIIDYSSPNIAKEMHVGHLRSTVIGDGYARVFEFLGYDVLRINHIGDWGTQFGMLLAHLTEKFPNYLTNTPPISDLQAFYKEAKKRFDDDEEFKKRAYNATVRLQAKESDMIKAWQQVCDISKAEFDAIYKTLGIQNLIVRGESFYNDRMKDVVAELEQKGLLIEEDGRKVMFCKDKSLPPLTIVKSDGGFTYDTSDMACIKQRTQEEKADRIVYVVDAGQGQHFQILFSCAQLAGWYKPEEVRVTHVGFGVVLGEDRKKFKTRSGETVRLKDLIEEGMQRSLAKLIEKGRDKELSADELKAAQEAVAIGCIKYADLSHDRNHEYVFSFDRMLDDRGNTAVYLLYALTRIRSIIRNAQNLKQVTLQEMLVEVPQLKLEHVRELKLAKYVLKFPEIILQVADDLYLHTLCGYLFELSVVFSEFYDQCYCIEKSLNEEGVEKVTINVERILLCEATAKVMEKGFHLLGIKTLDKM